MIQGDPGWNGEINMKNFPDEFSKSFDTEGDLMANSHPMTNVTFLLSKPDGSTTSIFL